jgi:hypothetical protein
MLTCFQAVVPLTSAIFSVGTEETTGGCVPQAAITDNWIAEAFQLHIAVETAYATWATDLKIRLLFRACLGVQFDLRCRSMPTKPGR